MSHNNSLIYNGLSPLLIVVSSFFQLGCNRPINCLTKSCESKVESAIVSDENAAQDSKKPEDPSTQTPAQNDALTREIKLLREREGFNDQIDLLTNKIQTLRQLSIEELLEQVEQIAKIRQEVLLKMDAESQKTVNMQKLRRKTYEEVLLKLQEMSVVLTPSRFQLLNGIESLELAILDPLTPEGVKTQLDFDQKLMDLDLARSRSDKPEIKKVQSEMISMINTLLVADKVLLLNMTNELVRLSLMLVDAHAPEQISALLKSMLFVEDKIEALKGIPNGELLSQYESQLDIIKKSMKLPLDTLPVWQLEEITQMETAYQTSFFTSQFLSRFKSFLEISDQSIRSRTDEVKLRVINAATNLEKIKSLRLEVEGNLQFIAPSAIILIAVMDQLQAGINELTMGLKTVIESTAKNPQTIPDSKVLDPFLSAHSQILKNLDETTKFIVALQTPISSKTLCSLGQPIKNSTPPQREISCSGQKVTILHP